MHLPRLDPGCATTVQQISIARRGLSGGGLGRGRGGLPLAPGRGGQSWAGGCSLSVPPACRWTCAAAVPVPMVSGQPWRLRRCPPCPAVVGLGGQPIPCEAGVGCPPTCTLCHPGCILAPSLRRLPAASLPPTQPWGPPMPPPEGPCPSQHRLPPWRRAGRPPRSPGPKLRRLPAGPGGGPGCLCLCFLPPPSLKLLN